MKKALVLIAGYPATGKTYLANLISNRYPGKFVIVDYDDVKEEFWDAYGFNDLAEKEELNAKALTEYYCRLEKAMAANQCVLSDYPFSDKQRGTLQALANKYRYDVLTIRMVGDLKTIIGRSVKRDLSPSRHLGHITSSYHKGDVLEDRSKADQLVDLETLTKRCIDRGYGSFSLGRTIEVDATDVSSIDYDSLLAEIDKFLLGKTEEIGKDGRGT